MLKSFNIRPAWANSRRQGLTLAVSAALACAVSGVLGCGRAPSGPARPAGPAATAAVPGRTGTSTLSGLARFSGTVPAAARTKVSNDSYCEKAAGSEVVDEAVLVSTAGGLANVFVWVKEGVSGSYPPPAAPAVLDQKGCAYRPRVFGLVAGQELKIRSEDATLHNVHAKAERNRSFNLAMPAPGTERSVRFAEPEVMVRIRCDVHGWMRSYAGVVAHPFFAVTKADGSYSVGSLPAGTYTLQAWHEALGTRERTVTVAEGATADVEPFDFAEVQGGSAPAKVAP